LKKLLAIISIPYLALTACWHVTNDPVIPEHHSVNIFDEYSEARFFAQDRDDPSKWHRSGIETLLMPMGMNAISQNPKWRGLQTWEELSTHPDLKQLLEYASISPDKQYGYQVSESWIVFADLGTNSNEFLYQAKVMLEQPGPYRYVYGKAKLADGNRVFYSIIDFYTLPDSMKNEFDCNMTTPVYPECAGLVKFEDIKRAIRSVEDKYVFYVQLN